MTRQMVTFEMVIAEAVSRGLPAQGAFEATGFPAELTDAEFGALVDRWVASHRATPWLNHASLEVGELDSPPAEDTVTLPTTPPPFPWRPFLARLVGALGAVFALLWLAAEVWP